MSYRNRPKYMPKIYTVCVELFKNNHVYYTDEGGKFSGINRTLKNKNTHITKGSQNQCATCGKHDDDNNGERMLVLFWVCGRGNWNPMLTGGENGVFGCPCCYEEFDTNLYI